MDSALASLPGLVPEGPLHPALPLAGVLIGISAAAMAGRSTRAWTSLAMLGVVFPMAAFQGDWLVGDVVARPDRALVMGVSSMVLLIGVASRLRRSTATVLALFACVGVWAIVPDTEAPLLSGGVLVGAGAVTLLPRWLSDTRRRVHGLLLFVPILSAAVGSTGRPARFEPAVVVALLVAVGGLALWTLGQRWWRRQRAGTPTTVLPAATSSMTTAPAPTMAS